ncbi:MAG: hypothetical protein AAF567_15075 [Actinomycetota bacterium]
MNRVWRGIELLTGWSAQQPVHIGGEVPMRTIRRSLLAFIVALIPLNLTVGFLKWRDYELDEQPLAFFVWFDVGFERNVPTWVSTLLLASGALAAVIASCKSVEPVLRRGYGFVAALMAWASFDEANEIHERASDPIRDALDLGGALYWSWVLVALVAVPIIVLLLRRFLLDLPEPTRTHTILSGVVFVGCAVGLEMFHALLLDEGGQGNVVTELLGMVEEFGEMLAAMLFVDATLRYASTQALEQAVEPVGS